MNAIFQLVNPSNTIAINRPLAQALGLNEAVIYGALISKYYYYSQHEMLDEGGWFYSTAPDLAESTALSEKQQKRAIDNLVKAGLIRVELRGMPAKRSFYIVQDVELLQSILAQGEEIMSKIKPAAAESYERKRGAADKNVTNQETQELISFLSESFGDDGDSLPENASEIDEKTENNACEPALLHCSDKRAEQAPPKGQTLLRPKGGAAHYSNLNINNQNNINQSITRTHAHEENSADGYDRIDCNEKRDYCLSELKKNIDYDCLCQVNQLEQRRIDELLAIMVDVICSAKGIVRVNGEEMPQSVVKSVFLRLNSEHIEYVLETLRNSTSDVKNIRSYLITTLYNAPNTIDSYYLARVNHDFAGR